MSKTVKNLVKNFTPYLRLLYPFFSLVELKQWQKSLLWEVTDHHTGKNNGNNFRCAQFPYKLCGRILDTIFKAQRLLPKLDTLYISTLWNDSVLPCKICLGLIFGQTNHTSRDICLLNKHTKLQLAASYQNRWKPGTHSKEKNR